LEICQNIGTFFDENCQTILVGNASGKVNQLESINLPVFEMKC